MERRGVGKRLTDGQRVEIIKLFDSGAAVTEADVARRYGVTRSAIWRLRRASQQIMERYQEGDIESRDDRRRGSNSALVAGASMGVISGMPDAQIVQAAGDVAAAFAAHASGNGGVLRPAAPGGVMPSGLDPKATEATGKKAAMEQVPENTVPLIYISAKAIGSVQSPGIMNWERVSGHGDEECFEVVNDGISVLQEGNYQVNVDLEHSQPRQNYKFAFKVWNGKKLLGQCSCPLRTKKEISLSLLEMRCRLPALAKLRVEFLAPGFAFHDSRVVLRLVQ
ncbi:hypothetical protein BBJ28_00016371 [Nothophytophthora sp. Chile5]|nr:hypothetical protein BBJ28_00016371 [Nothophytophthora sp. Chile5]